MLRYRNHILAALTLGLVLAVGLVSAVSTDAAPPPPPPEYDTTEGPVFLVISFDPAFRFDHPRESETIMVNIGSIVGGSDILDTRFVVDAALEGVVLPDGRKDPLHVARWTHGDGRYRRSSPIEGVGQFGG